MRKPRRSRRYTAWGITALASLLAGYGAVAAGAETTFSPLAYGENVNESLINPFEPGKNEDDLTRQVSGILHAVRMDGGSTVRWFVTGVWPQYRCSRDPEDQSTGDLDPAWFTISKILLQQAQHEGISVVVVMADTTNDAFAGLPRADDKRASEIAAWSSYRAAQRGRDRYSTSAATCDRSFQNGYRGRVHPEAIFEDAELAPHFTNRFLKMAQYLKQFPALGALEMFNEPRFAESQKPQFARMISTIRNSLYAQDPSLRTVPLYSGAAFWSDKLANNLSAADDLRWEPYINLHYYRKATTEPRALTDDMLKNVEYLRRVAPDKPVIIAEAGAADPVYDLQEHADFLQALLDGMPVAHVGMWTWGTFANDATLRPDFKWEYNSTALSGGAFRKLLIATDAEDAYRTGKTVAFVGSASHQPAPEPVTIDQVASDDSNPLWRLRWQISVGRERFISISRAGILTRVAPAMRGVLSEPGSVVAIDADAGKREWTEIAAEAGRWSMKIYQCEAPGSNGAATPTPPYVVEYAGKLGRTDFKNCERSSVIRAGAL